MLSRENRGYFTAVYTAKVRLTVQANEATIIREGHGTGEGRGEFPGEVHDTAVKAAETDATKRALATFGRPFGLELYRGSQPARQMQAIDQVRSAAPVQVSRVVHAARTAAHANPPVAPQHPHALAPVGQSSGSALHVEAAPELAPVEKFAHDDTIPIPRPPSYFGREHYHDIREENGAVMRQAARDAARQLLPPPPMQRIDKADLPLSEPKRIRDKEHLKFVAKQACLVCGRQPSDAHHVRFAQPRALGLKVSDEFTVPLCRTHHRNLHQAGNELTWWEKARIEPLPIARELWETSHPRAASRSEVQNPAATKAKTVAESETWSNREAP